MPTLNRRYCIGDDLANCCGHCDKNVVAVIPVLGRLPLLKHTIERLLKKNGVTQVICIGQSSDERDVCEKAGAQFIRYKNNPLGQKWNAGFQEAKRLEPDACLFVGSSDWLSDNWLRSIAPYMNNYDMVGMPGCYFLDIGQTLRLVHWPGYTGRREGESIGIGRVISSRLLDQLDWQPFDNHLENSMDFSMYQKVQHSKRYLLKSNDVFSLSISTNRWPNKHQFEAHWQNVLPSEKVDNPEAWLKQHFPEAFTVFA